MAIAIAAGPTASTITDYTTSHATTFTIVNNSTAGRLVELRLVFKVFDNLPDLCRTITACTLDGVAFTEQVTICDYSNSQYTQVFMFTMDNATLPTTAGTYNISITASANMQCALCEIIEYSGVDSVADTDTDVAFTGSPVLAPLDPGDYVSAAIGWATQTGAVCSLTTGTEQYNGHIGAQTTHLLALTGYNAGGSTITGTMTGADRSEAAACISYNALAGGPNNYAALMLHGVG